MLRKPGRTLHIVAAVVVAAEVVGTVAAFTGGSDPDGPLPPAANWTCATPPLAPAPCAVYLRGFTPE